ncbi:MULTISPECIES: class F sortase [Brevibacillus]|uniref:class F sortase n=1 Tax=Brevibacillus TaxID=55080 RepID=UPI000B9A5162|nr:MULTISPECIES: class F sortase [Brevibacillus]MBG9789908.1 sortase [Brevibacillus laterosporus]MCG7317004.1 class F sortase [Brevibacillus laterosporus]MED1786691.1 class F sortase [Brevibacillus laterosporus]RFB32770.1 class F sortase [Brevibacillus sp. VP]
MRIIFLALLICILSGCSNSASPEKKPNIPTPLPIDQTFPQIQEKQLHTKQSKAVPSPNSQTKPEMNTTCFIPNRLQIPSIGLDTAIETVGITVEGNMDVPKSFDKVGILTPWTKPGEKGNAVIAGHFDHYTGPAIFYHLKKLKHGDHVIVSDSNDHQLIYVVKEVTAFKTKEAPLERIFGETGTSNLNLITCSGKFNKKTQEHAKRLVVFTELNQ